MMRMRIVSSLLTLCLLGALPLDAKCAFHQYVFNGTVVEDSGRIPVAGARVVLFLDDYESTYAGGYLTKYPDFFESSREGAFKAVSHFYSFRKVSLFGGDVCDKEPKRVEVVVTAPGFLSKRVVLPFGNLQRSRPSRSANVVKLPAILLKRSK